MATEHIHEHEDHGSVFKRIILPFIWLILLTGLEFLIALSVKKTADIKAIIDITFIVLTLVKAFFIVSYFMHLKWELKGLRWSIVAPMMFIVYLLVLMVLEGQYMLEALYPNVAK